MPEGPEVRREADRIAAVLVGAELTGVEFGLPALARHAPVLAESRVTAVRTHGKALLTQFGNGYTVYSHNQLYGRWYVCRRGRSPKTGRQLRFALHTADHSALLYSASAIEVWETTALDAHPFLRRLGPDALDEALTWRDVAARLALPAFARRRLASVYLDQGFVAGIGNYLRSEILFAARANPFPRAGDLGRGELGRLARATLAVCRRAYATAGVTNPPRAAAALRRAGAKRGEWRFAVFGRDGRACVECGGEVARVTAGRRLYYCAACQDVSVSAP